MHIYRDAIRRSAGAYVLYPGTSEQQRFDEYHEILPGLGAFALRPSTQGPADPQGAAPLRRFLNDVLRHVANQASQRERAWFWRDRSYERSDASSGLPTPVAPWLKKPPEDTRVLLGYVRGPNMRPGSSGQSSTTFEPMGVAGRCRPTQNCCVQRSC